MKVSYDEVVEKLRAIVASKPDDYKYTYDPKALEASKALDEGNGVWTDDEGNLWATTCVYRFLDDTPGCIVGHLLDAYDPHYRPTEGSPAVQAAKQVIELDEKTGKLLSGVQAFQDAGNTWRDSLQMAKNG